jgi:uncharacterized membrane protein
MKRAVWLVFLSVAASLATAQVVELIPKWDDSPSSNPRSNLSLVIEVRNTDTLGHSIVLRPHLPEGWRELVSAFPGHLGPGEAGARIVALFVPQEARAGVYVVEIDAIDAETDQTLATLVVPVEVLPNVDLELTILDGSTYVVVGEVIVLPLRVTNQSNIDLLVTLSQRGRYEFSAWFDGTEDGQIRIPPNESVRLVANLQT